MAVSPALVLQRVFKLVVKDIARWRRGFPWRPGTHGNIPSVQTQESDAVVQHCGLEEYAADRQELVPEITSNGRRRSEIADGVIGAITIPGFQTGRTGAGIHLKAHPDVRTPCEVGFCLYREIGA